MKDTMAYWQYGVKIISKLYKINNDLWGTVAGRAVFFCIWDQATIQSLHLYYTEQSTRNLWTPVSQSNPIFLHPTLKIHTQKINPRNIAIFCIWLFKYFNSHSLALHIPFLLTKDFTRFTFKLIYFIRIENSECRNKQRWIFHLGAKTENL